jgi:hypothetical protein
MKLKVRARAFTTGVFTAVLIGTSLFCSTTAAVSQSQSQDRPPAIPLIAHDPYFSVWSMTDTLTGGPTRHWTGAEQPLNGVIRIDGKPLRYMGEEPHELPAMAQTSLKVTPTSTIYTFEANGVRLGVTFFTPAFTQDLDILSRPVTYLTWNVASTDGHPHSVKIFLDVDPRIAVNTEDEEVTWGRSSVPGLTVLNVGSRDQRVLSRAGDNLRIDWGYFHLAVPVAESGVLAESSDSMDSFVASGELPRSDDMEMPSQPRNGAAHLAAAFPIEITGSETIRRHVLLAYTENYSIEYLGRKLRPYWERNGQTPSEVLAAAENQYVALEAQGKKFDQELTSDLERVGGKPYAELGILAYRQTLAAHGLAADVDGTPMLFPKENFSNGCISTVDVLYPSGPFFLFFSPKLLEAQLKPVLEYAALPRWKWPFAPHDLGTYPLANGQVYGGGEHTEEDQMPVEESGNMLILIDALGRERNDWHLAREYWPTLSKWAEYLKAKGLDPENQLSTDDFAGHLAHNANLSIKAIEGLAAYAQIAQALGKSEIAKNYGDTAKEMAAKWETMAKEGDHYKLAFDKPDSWSQKYNLVWDQLLDLKLFPAKIRETELAFYLKHLNKYGLPLDNREDYTKLDWQLWTATLTDDPSQFNALMAPIGKWMNETPSRVPLTDFYDTKTGKMVAFQARSVVGGIYIKALADRQLAKKWRDKEASSN